MGQNFTPRNATELTKNRYNYIKEHSLIFAQNVTVNATIHRTVYYTNKLIKPTRVAQKHN